MDRGQVTIELLYVEDCPGFAELRPRLDELIAASGVEARIVERLIDSDMAARRERFRGSPSVRVAGEDVDPTPPASAAHGLCCRLYATPEGPRRRPPDAWITRALGDRAEPA